MSNYPQPLKVIQDRLGEIRHQFHAIALRDGEYDSQERAFIRLIDHTEDFAEESHTRKQLSGLIEKGGDVSTYMNNMASVLNLKIVPLDDYRDSEKIVPFRRENGAG